MSDRKKKMIYATKLHWYFFYRRFSTYYYQWGVFRQHQKLLITIKGGGVLFLQQLYPYSYWLGVKLG